ncbi:NAD(P)H-dependent oxidoreductase [Saccharopolyspora sp. 5N708]|uniref:NAD(P)H-dependent oxidoreductase n=1 Tax=Saccharopolyspora sp. 5N708 TaxID=3457424 RepID=UPI003FD04224
MAHIALITTSPTSRSRLGAITRILGRELNRAGGDVTTVALFDLPHSALLVGDQQNQQIRRTHRLLATARAAVLVIPTYEASGSALLRAWLALLPPGAFAGKTVQAVGLGAIRSHAIGLGSGLGQHSPERVLPGCFLYERWLEGHAAGWRVATNAADQLAHTATEVCTAAARKPTRPRGSRSRLALTKPRC